MYQTTKRTLRETDMDYLGRRKGQAGKGRRREERKEVGKNVQLNKNK